MRTTTVLGAIALSTVLAIAGAAPAEPEPFRYVRDATGTEHALRLAISEARARGAESALIVFDAATFAPPPGRNEFRQEHDFSDEFERWLPAVVKVAERFDMPLRVASTDGGESWPASELGAAQVKFRLATSTWWDQDVEPATKWMRRLVPDLPSGPRALVLVTGDVLPEAWADGEEPWRRRLLPVGDYWKEEAVSSVLRAANARLVVIAPEARFGDFLPVQDLPDVPWASRPQAPSMAVPSAFDRGDPGVPDLGGREELERQFREQGMSEERIAEIVDALEARVGEVAGAGNASPLRFHAATPTWFRGIGNARLVNTHCPSAYGHWPFARVAAATGGCYVFYPFPAGRWLDNCPRDPSLVDALAPEFGTRASAVASSRRDPTVRALVRAMDLVIEKTPWSDDSNGFSQGGAESWFGFAGPGARIAKRWAARRKPVDRIADGGGVAEFERLGRNLFRVLPRYDDAAALLARAERDLADDPRASRRGRANLRLARFWFELSAFHLHALAIFCTETERFRPDDTDPADVHVTYVTAIRMSDCLDSYDGLTIGPEDEERFGRARDPRGIGPRLPSFLRRPKGAQDNLLTIPFGFPQYRARRNVERVLANVDPRLRPRANRMIAAARDVMRHEARSAWGWVTYYSEANTFVWMPLPPGDAIQRRQGDDPLPPPPTPGGSSPGGPPTK